LHDVVVADVAPVLEAVRAQDPTADLALVRRCYEFAAERHAGQLRRSGDPYVVHPLGVAKIIAELKLDVASVCAGLLHDCVEDTSATAEDIGRLFGPEIQALVEGVTKLGQIPWNTREERAAENFRKMLLAMARDLRVILIKLADRVDNMRTLQHMPRDKQERIARETREIYAPMANRLGIQWMKAELEDLCFMYLEPEDYRDLVARMADTEGSRQKYIAETCEKIRQVMKEAEIETSVTGRAKHLWSVQQKMRKTSRELEQIHDIIAFRLIVGSVRDCYAALGVVHSHWTPVPGRFKDFIALPKPNLYQSLHTTVIGPQSERMEVQIRTQDMHHTAEQGIAAHWKYKEKRPFGTADSKSFAWLHQLMEWQRDLKDPTEFIETVKIDLFEEEVFVFTPKGDVKSLPKGSTPIDFAYAVHSKVGDHCSGARVNGLIVPLRYPLRNGDTVDILTSSTQKPSKDWLKFVITSRAQTRIRHFLRMEQRERSATGCSRKPPNAFAWAPRTTSWSRSGTGRCRPRPPPPRSTRSAPRRRARRRRHPRRIPPPWPSGRPRGRWAGFACRARRTSWSSSPSAAPPSPGTPSWPSSAVAAASSCTRGNARRRSIWIPRGRWRSPGTTVCTCPVRWPSRC
jgi:GTP pyrophosphokinase